MKLTTRFQVKRIIQPKIIAKREKLDKKISKILQKKHKKRLKLNEEEIKKVLLIFQELVSIANEEESSLEEEGGGSVDSAVSILSILAQ